ncbi:Dabb family protein [Planctomicrobium piriforme]|uniref:Stress responsive A/B Barrel Domain n=1 Tax=Planctomicrobium piriforme TaxID=1576369 RepID=A0A1I3BF15_9PLAN|nr:Dabb family protein [Planctomicrobium piriforme]SFH60740.1 Stress responsive A/B Barrel Domain [Planctomicrobium piriforme]
MRMLLCSICLFALFLPWVRMTHGAEPTGKLLRHIVLYKFKPEMTTAQVQEVVDAFAALPSKIDLIVSLEKGTNVSQENKSDGLTHSFVVTFRSQADLAKYLDHPAHLDYVKLVRDRREKVVVFDYWTE